jgi:hypothetical protein
MSQCPEVDALLAVGDAFAWDVERGLRHLQSCDECRTQLDVLRQARAGFAESEAVDPVVLQRIAARVGDAAREEQMRAASSEQLVRVAEAVLAGVATLAVIASNRIPVDSAATGLLAFTIGALLMAGGSALARTAMARTTSANA